MCTVELETRKSQPAHAHDNIKPSKIVSGNPSKALFITTITHQTSKKNPKDSTSKMTFGHPCILVVTVDPIPLHILACWQDPEES